MSEPQVTFHPMWPSVDPWRQEQVRLDGEPIGYLLYRRIPPIPGLGPGWAQYLVSDDKHRPVGEGDYRCSFLYRDRAVDALIAEVTARAEVA